MRINKYTDIVESENQCFLIDFLNKHVIQLNPKLALLLRKYWNNIDALEHLHNKFYVHILNMGVIIENGHDEVADCINRFYKETDSTEHLKITVNPTLDCNLRCWYCYEEHGKGTTMNEQILERIKKYFKKIAEDADVKTFDLSFFGGEPLIGFQKILLPLLNYSNNIFTQNEIKFSCSITTNGTLLSPSKLQQILSISKNLHLQIPFDGGKDWHNKTKKYFNGNGSYEMVVKNAKYALDNGVGTTIRCNYTNENINSFMSLLEDFKEYAHNKNTYISFQKVWQTNRTPETLAVLNKIKDFADKLGFRTNLNDPNYRIRRCYADFSHNIVINYNGDVFHCTARNFDQGSRDGVINSNGEIVTSELFIKRQKKRLLKVCHSCSILPICGVCSQNKMETSETECPSKNNIKEKSTFYKNKYFEHNIYPRIKK